MLELYHVYQQTYVDPSKNSVLCLSIMRLKTSSSCLYGAHIYPSSCARFPDQFTLIRFNLNSCRDESSDKWNPMQYISPLIWYSRFQVQPPAWFTTSNVHHNQGSPQKMFTIITVHHNTWRMDVTYGGGEHSLKILCPYLVLIVWAWSCYNYFEEKEQWVI